MPDFQSTTHTVSLQPVGPTRRSSPALQREIGKDEADLLLQIDYWCNFEGDKNGWMRKSSTEMQREAFPMWSKRHIQNLLNRLCTDALILIINLVPPLHPLYKDKTPVIALNYERLPNLVSVRLLSSARVAQGCAQDAQVCARVAQGPQVVRSHTSYIYKSSIRPKNRKLFGENKGDTTSDQPPFEEVIKSSPSKSFALALANVCKLDYDLNREKVQASALELWEAGYHDPEELFDVKAWWFEHDWRGQQDSPPHLSQVKEVIAQALDHEDTQKRHNLRHAGHDPDSENADRLRYISGDYSDLISY